MEDYSRTIDPDKLGELRDQNKDRSDSELWKSFKDGNEEAFVTIYKNYVNFLFNIGIQYCPDEDLVKDCLQDFFVSLMDKRENLADVRDIKFYLIKAFVRRIIHYLKKTKKTQVIGSKEAFSIELISDDRFIDSMFDEEQLKKLDDAIKKLGEKEREAIYYYYYQNLSYAQIAEIYHYEHVSSARRLIYKCLEKLKEKYILIPLILHLALAYNRI
jgi:RNA polymerase sigma factor (sigma-70 family)